MAADKAHSVAVGKDEGRGVRLRVSNFLEEQVRKEWMGMARKGCDPLVRSYWLCRNDSGLGVILKCRQQLADMNACLGMWNGDPELYAKYSSKRLPELQGTFAKGTPNPKFYDAEGKALIPKEYEKLHKKKGEKTSDMH